MTGQNGGVVDVADVELVSYEELPSFLSGSSQRKTPNTASYDEQMADKEHRRRLQGELARQVQQAAAEMVVGNDRTFIRAATEIKKNLDAIDDPWIRQIVEKRDKAVINTLHVAEMGLTKLGLEALGRILIEGFEDEPRVPEPTVIEVPVSRRMGIVERFGRAIGEGMWRGQGNGSPNRR